MIPYNAVLKQRRGKKNKQRKLISVLKENRQAELFVEKYPEKREAFKYPLATFPLAISTAEGKYQPKTKYHFKNYFIELSKTKVSEINSFTMQWLSCAQFHL